MPHTSAPAAPTASAHGQSDRGNSISSINIPDFMSAGQILPPDGLASFTIDKGNTNIDDHTDLSEKHILSTTSDAFSLAQEELDATVDLYLHDLIMRCRSECEDGRDGDGAYVINVNGVERGRGRSRGRRNNAKQPRGKMDWDGKFDGVRGRFRTHDVVGDDMELSYDEDDGDEEGGVLIASPHAPTSDMSFSSSSTDVANDNHLTTEKFPLIDEDLAAAMIEQEHTWGTMPIRNWPATHDKDYVVIDRSLMDELVLQLSHWQLTAQM